MNFSKFYSKCISIYSHSADTCFNHYMYSDVTSHFAIMIFVLGGWEGGGGGGGVNEIYFTEVVQALYH